MLRLSFCCCVFVVLLSSSLAADNTTTNSPDTTEKPTTPTTTPTTTSSSTTTTTKPTPTTTPKPTPTTTTAPVTTTVKPDVLPWPKNVGHWFVNDTKNSNISCLVIDAAFQVTITYQNVENKTVTGTIDIPKNAVGTGSCKDDTADLTITWPVSNGSADNSLELEFRKHANDQDKDVFGLYQINLTVTPEFSDIKENNTLAIQADFNKEARFRTPLNKSYTCMKEPPIPVGNITSVVIGLKVGKLQVEAFRSTAFDKFSPEFECSADDVSAVVPFAVGASLALLVVIVLIAYLIGRRRSRARGYQSV